MNVTPLVFILPLSLCVCMACSDRTTPDPAPRDAATKFATAACQVADSCGCGSYETSAQCQEILAARFGAFIDAGATLDENCLEQWLESPLFTQCPTELSADPIPSCKVLTGHANEGSACGPGNLLGLVPGGGCGEGLMCSLGGHCTSTADEPLQAGDTCNAGFYLSCNDVDLYCAPEGVCVTRAPDGEACDSYESCSLTSYCSATGTCTPREPLGAACDPMASGRSCDPAGAPNVWCNPATLVCEAGEPFVCRGLGVYPPT